MAEQQHKSCEAWGQMKPHAKLHPSLAKSLEMKTCARNCKRVLVENSLNYFSLFHDVNDDKRWMIGKLGNMQ